MVYEIIHRHTERGILVQKWFLTLFILLVSFNVFDVVATRHILTYQGDMKYDLVWYEGNPVGRYMIDNWGYSGIGVYKIILTLILGTLLLIYEKKNRVVPIMMCATIPYAAVVTWEIYIIFFLL